MPCEMAAPGARLPAAVSSSTRCECWTGIFALCAAAVALGYAIQINNGNFTREALAWLSIAIVFCAIGVWNRPYHRLESAARGPILWMLGAGLLFQLAPLLTANPGADLWVPLHPFRLMVFAAAGVAVLGFFPIPAARWALPLLLLIHFFMGAWVIRHTPQPQIDVHVVQQAGCEALAHGRNPYAIRTRDLYGPDSHYYPPGAVKDGRLTFGCPYPPLSILLALPGYLLGGDFRYAQLLALTMAAALMGLCRGGRLGFAAAALFLLSPRGFYVLEHGWTEPFVVMLVTATVFCAYRRPRWTPLALGLLLVSKQYVFIALPAALLLAPRPWGNRAFWRFWFIAAITGLVVTLPMVLWNVREFINSVLNIRDVFRVESLSYLSLLARTTGWRAGGWVKFVAILPAIVLVLRKAPRSPSGFAAGTALLFMVLFAFAPHASANYYFGSVGILCCAVAAAAAPRLAAK